MNEYKRKPVADMDLLDDFLFWKMLNHPDHRERFAKILMETILGRPVGQLAFVTQRAYYGTREDRRGIRTDVYLKELADDGTVIGVFDLEPMRCHGRKDIGALPKRTRFYHAMIDANALRSGADFTDLCSVSVIMITPVDPFGRGRTRYTVRSLCEEDRSAACEDASRTIYLYTRGKTGDEPEALRALLRYMERSVGEHAVNETLQELHQMVTEVKRGKETPEEMKWFEELQRERDEGIHQGIHQGIAQGIQEGLHQGIAQGVARERANTERERKNTERERLRAESAEALLRQHGISF